MGNLYGINVNYDGSVHWDQRVLINQLPPSARGPASQAITGAINGDYTAAVNGAFSGAEAVLSTAGPVGLVAAGAVALVQTWMNSTAPATIDWSWDHIHGSFDPGPPFSFRRYANATLLGVWNDSIVARHMGGTGYEYGMVLASSLAACAEQWNSTHQPGPYETVSYPDAYPCGWGGSSEPIAVAAESLMYYAGTGCGKPWSMTVNAGAVHTPIGLGSLVQAAPALNVNALSFRSAPAKPGVSPLLIAAGAIATVAIVRPQFFKKLLGRR